MALLKIKQAIIVEGKYDKIKLDSIVDALVIETEGFGIFKNKEKMDMLKRLASTRGLLILTDSDAAGFTIRSHIVGYISPENIIHAYIPDIFGKEKRKQTSSKEGKLGVEGVSRDIIIEALTRAGVGYEEVSHGSRLITNTDLYEYGFSGGPDSKLRRKELLKRLDLPERLSTNSLIKALNIFMTYEEFVEIAEESIESSINIPEVRL